MNNSGATAETTILDLIEDIKSIAEQLGIDI